MNGDNQKVSQIISKIVAGSVATAFLAWMAWASISIITNKEAHSMTTACYEAVLDRLDILEQLSEQILDHVRPWPRKLDP